MDRLKQALKAITAEIEHANAAMRREGIEPDAATGVVLAAAWAVVNGCPVEWCDTHDDTVRPLYGTCNKAYRMLRPSTCRVVSRVLVDVGELQ